MAVRFRNLQGGNPYQGLADTMERVSGRVGSSFMSYGNAVRQRNEKRDQYKAQKERSLIDNMIKLGVAAVGYENQQDALEYKKEQDRLNRQFREQESQRTADYRKSVLSEQAAAREQRGTYQQGMLERQDKILQNSNKIKEITALTRLENAEINKLKQQNLKDKIPFDQYRTAAKLAEDVSSARLTRRTKLYELYTDIYGEEGDLTNPNRDPETGAANMPFDMWVTSDVADGGYGMSKEEFDKLSEPFTYLDVYRQAGIKLTDENVAPPKDAEDTVLAELTNENNARLGSGTTLGSGPKPGEGTGSGVDLGTGTGEEETSSVDIKSLTEDTSINPPSLLERALEPKKFGEDETEDTKLSPQDENEVMLERLASLSDERLSKVLNEVDDPRLRGLIRVEMDRRKKGDSTTTSAIESSGSFGTLQANTQTADQQKNLPAVETVPIKKGSTLKGMYDLAVKNGFDPSVYYNEVQKKKGANLGEKLKIFKDAWSDHRESQGLIRLGRGDGEIPPKGEDRVLPKFWSDPVEKDASKRSALKDGTETGEDTDQGEPNMEVANEAIDNASVLASGTKPKTESLIKPLSEEEISQLDEYIYSPNTSRFTLKASGMEDFAKRNGYRVDYGPDADGNSVMKFTKAEGEDRGEVISLTRKRRETLAEFYERVEKELLIPNGFK